MHLKYKIFYIKYYFIYIQYVLACYSNDNGLLHDKITCPKPVHLSFSMGTMLVGFCGQFFSLILNLNLFCLV